MLRAGAVLIAAGGALLIALPGCSSDDGGNGSGTPIVHAQDLLPTSISGWQQQGESVTGTTADELDDYVDGDAPFYVEHNMKEFASASYLGTDAQSGAELDVVIAEMTASADAAALYNDSRISPPSPESESGIGDVARTWSTLFGKVLEFTRDNYYAKLSIENMDGETAENQLRLIATGIDQEMQP